MNLHRCLKIPVAKPTAQKRLCFFHHAGGSAVNYFSFARLAPATIEVLLVELPGHGSRQAEPLLFNIGSFAEEITGSIAAFMDKPIAFFGHSMGAVVAFETNRLLTAAHKKGCAHLFVSACRSPRLLQENRARYAHNISKAELIARLRMLGGTPEELLQDPDWLDFILPPYRADLAALADYVYRPHKILSPCTVLGGTLDKEINFSDLEDWQSETSGDFVVKMFSGAHFFLLKDPQGTFDYVLERFQEND